MRELIGDPATYEQLAEECTELAKAALKMARILRGENPTPVTSDECMANMVEEASDVVLCLNDLGIEADKDIMRAKMARFHSRWDEAHG